MLLLAGIILAIVVGLVAGGRIDRLAALQLTALWVAPLAFVAQLLAIYGSAAIDDALSVSLIVGSHIALLLFALRNLRTAGMAVAALGVAMNLAVMLANGGLMPVSPETLQSAGRTEAWKIGDGTPGTRLARSKDVIRLRDQTFLEPLADRFTTGLPGPLSIIFSLGDVVLLGGVCLLVVQTMTDPSPSRLHFAQRGVP